MAVGFTYFAAFMMILAGAFDALQGFAAIVKQSYYVVAPNYVYKFNVTTWGWINLILGIVILLAGAALLSGAVWARTIGVLMAILVGIANFMWLPYYPVWSIIVIAICVIIVWALTAHGRDAAS
jgi:hypothetical protein